MDNSVKAKHLATLAPHIDLEKNLAENVIQIMGSNILGPYVGEEKVCQLVFIHFVSNGYGADAIIGDVDSSHIAYLQLTVAGVDDSINCFCDNLPETAKAVEDFISTFLVEMMDMSSIAITPYQLEAVRIH